MYILIAKLAARTFFRNKHIYRNLFEKKGKKIVTKVNLLNISYNLNSKVL